MKMNKIVLLIGLALCMSKSVHAMQEPMFRGMPISQAMQGAKLKIAVLEEDIQKVQHLIQKGAPIDYEHEDDEKLTPLILATHTQNSAIAQLLLQAGANVFFTSKKGRRALTDAVQYGGNAQLLNVLLTAAFTLPKEIKLQISKEARSWLLVANRLANLPKDIRRLIAKYICYTYESELRQQINGAGAADALAIARALDASANLTDAQRKNISDAVTVFENALTTPFIGSTLCDQVMYRNRIANEQNNLHPNEVEPMDTSE